MARRSKRSDGLLQKSFRVKIRGISKQFVVYGHNESELIKKELAKRAEIEQGIAKLDNPTVSDYFCRWIERRRGTVKEATIRMDNKIFGVVSKITVPELSNIRFADLRMQDVDIEVLRTVQKTLKDEGRKTRTVNDYMGFVKHLFSDSMKERVISYDPCVLLKDLKRSEERARDTNHRALSLEEQKAFFESERCKSSSYYNVLRFAVLTGMRIGEIAALRYSDIRDGTIYIERTITRTESGSYKIGDDAKTAAGRRTIPINDQIAQVINDQKRQNDLLYGCVTGINDRLFRAVQGGILTASPVDRDIKRICKAAGIEYFSVHALRDTFATRCIESGQMQMRTLMELMGHTEFSLTYSLYGHCLPDTQKKEMSAVVIAI